MIPCNISLHKSRPQKHCKYRIESLPGRNPLTTPPPSAIEMEKPTATRVTPNRDPPPELLVCLAADLPRRAVQEKECFLCLEPFRKKDAVFLWSCNHYYHGKCHETINAAAAAVCPICTKARSVYDATAVKHVLSLLPPFTGRRSTDLVALALGEFMPSVPCDTYPSRMVGNWWQMSFLPPIRLYPDLLAKAAAAEMDVLPPSTKPPSPPYAKRVPPSELVKSYSTFDETDIALIMTHAHVSRHTAIAALQKEDGDIVSAIMSITM